MENKQNKSNSVLQGVKESVTVKLSVIVVLSLILLLLTSMINSIVDDRQKRRREVVGDIQEKWGGPQQITGPILTLYAVYADSSKGVLNKYTKKMYLLPEELEVKGKVDPEVRKRSLYEVAVYNSEIQLKGNFKPGNYLSSAHFLGFNKVILSTGIDDMRGINNQVDFKIDGEILKVQSGLLDQSSGITDLSVLLDKDHVDLNKSISFDLKFNLKGSDEIKFVPVGKSTKVNISSPWPDPGYSGAFLPDQSEITSEGFLATWNINSLNRSFPQSWNSKDNWFKLSNQNFGVKMIRPANDYQKITRLVKYAILSIALTFLTFFLLEIIKKWQIHPFQYILVGLALTLFYILLVALSEHLGFNISYAICTAVVVSLIGFYSASVFKQATWSMVLSFLIIGVYSFLFVTLQLEDYALLMGSIGLVFMLAATMYLTRNINWYSVGSDNTNKETSINEPETGAF